MSPICYFFEDFRFVSTESLFFDNKRFRWILRSIWSLEGQMVERGMPISIKHLAITLRAIWLNEPLYEFSNNCESDILLATSGMIIYGYIIPFLIHSSQQHRETALLLDWKKKQKLRTFPLNLYCICGVSSSKDKMYRGTRSFHRPHR